MKQKNNGVHEILRCAVIFFCLLEKICKRKHDQKEWAAEESKWTNSEKKWISCNWKQIAIVSHTFQNILIWRFANEWTIKDLRAEAEDKETAKYITWKDELKQLKSFIKFAFLFQFIQWIGRFFRFLLFSERNKHVFEVIDCSTSIEEKERVLSSNLAVYNK